MINGCEACRNTTNYPIFNMQDFRYWLRHNFVLMVVPLTHYYETKCMWKLWLYDMWLNKWYQRYLWWYLWWYLISGCQPPCWTILVSWYPHYEAEMEMKGSLEMRLHCHASGGHLISHSTHICTVVQWPSSILYYIISVIYYLHEKDQNNQ